MAQSSPRPLTTTRRRGWNTVDYVLIVVCAALYAAALIAVAYIKLGPSVSLRPGNALQSVFGVLFGMPGALGVGLGNVLSDMYTGAPGPHAIILGFFSNFAGAFIPYLVLSNVQFKTVRSWIEWYLGVAVLTSAVVAYAIYINVWLGLTPSLVAAAFAPTVFFNQLIPAAIISPILLKLLYPYVSRAGLFRGRESAR